MEIRDARPSDADGIASVARESLRASYGGFIDEETIDDVVEKWYSEDRVAEELDHETTLWIVGDDDGVAAFVQGALVDAEPPVGELHWLHVAPGDREGGLARQLLGGAQERFEKRGAAVLRGLVLSDNEEGTTFYEANDFEKAGERDVTIEGEEYTEYVYEHAIGEGADEAVVEPIEGPDGDLFVNFSEGERGIEAPLYATYRTRDFEQRYGWYCSNCESTSTAMDAMGRIECNDCGNYRKATRWDASYL